jgi:hypothetical protein
MASKLAYINFNELHEVLGIALSHAENADFEIDEKLQDCERIAGKLFCEIANYRRSIR